jgi:hypothetical protein
MHMFAMSLEVEVRWSEVDVVCVVESEDEL